MVTPDGSLLVVSDAYGANTHPFLKVENKRFMELGIAYHHNGTIARDR